MTEIEEKPKKALYEDDSDDDDDIVQSTDIDHTPVAQYLDDEDLEEEDEFEADRQRIGGEEIEDDYENEDGSSETPSAASSNEEEDIDDVEAQYNSLPLSALAEASSRLDNSNDNEEADKRKSNRAEAIAKAKEELWEKQQSKGKDSKEKERKELQKRANKHAPTEVTSKRPTSRKREVVEVDKIRSRDPRFLSLSGNFSQDLFEKSFSFLKGSLSKEVAEAKEQLKAAQLNIRRARSLPGQSEDKTYLIEEHQAEVDRLTHEIQRMSSQAKTSQKKDIEKEALRKIKKEERDKRGEGKKAYYLKDSEKRKRVEEAQKEVLRAQGGNKAVKKSEERKRKRHEGKEKKSLPWTKTGGRDSVGTKRRKA
ncbi:DUF947-domain-containing protein [Wallemia mellicola]|nr:DUF947-domain-containing protein [Wallemia mellicola]TIC15284.1 DUF947-domain-containing protein [Wallemia mellicola]TIC49074.1 DUF947-domain-containing protein [Wallemia mellicola]